MSKSQADVFQKGKRKKLAHRDVKIKEAHFGVFDLETHGLGGVSVAVEIFDGDVNRTQRQFYGEGHLKSALLAMINYASPRHIYRWYAHNGKKYDFLYLKACLLELKNEGVIETIIPIPQGNDFIGYRIVLPASPENPKKKLIVELRDSIAIFPSSLKKFARLYAEKCYQKKDIGLKKGEMFNPHDRKHQQYLHYDCLSLYSALKGYERVLHEKFGVNMGWTTGGIAMALFRRLIPRGHVFYRARPEVEDFIRETYHGGLVFIGHTKGTRGKTTSVDLHAAYAGIGMRGVFPFGSAIHVFSYQENKIGYYHVKFTSPPGCRIAVIPHKDTHQKVWTCGENIEAYCTSVDIEAALKLGYKVEVLEGYIFDKEEVVFDEFIRLCAELEHSSPDAKPAAKNMRNSLYGKFGTKQETEEYIICDDLPDGYDPLIDEDTGAFLDGIYQRSKVVDEDYMLIQWASLITARVRCFNIGVIAEVYRWGDENGVDTDVYCDTDSDKISGEGCFEAMVESGVVKLGKEYGDFTLEYVLQDFYVLGPKSYVGVLSDSDAQRSYEQAVKSDDEPLGEGKHHNIVRKAKGVPFKQLDDNGQMKLDADRHLRLVQQGTSHLIENIRSMRCGRTLWKSTDGRVSDLRRRTFNVELNSNSFIEQDGQFHPRYIVG